MDDEITKIKKFYGYNIFLDSFDEAIKINEKFFEDFIRL